MVFEQDANFARTAFHMGNRILVRTVVEVRFLRRRCLIERHSSLFARFDRSGDVCPAKFNSLPIFQTRPSRRLTT